MIKRYHFLGATECEETPTGEWVRYADIERDLQELQVLRAALGRQPIDDNDVLP